MREHVRRGQGWTVVWVVSMPLLLIAFLGTQMATVQVTQRFEAYRAIPEITRAADLKRVSSTQPVLLRGRISPASCQMAACDTEPQSKDLIIYREGPAKGREIRFQESFGQHVSAFVLDLPDDTVHISPSLTQDHVIQDARHTTTDGDRMRQGFRLGDVVTVQGVWQPTPAQALTLTEVTGVTSQSKEALLQSWQNALRNVRWASLVSGLLTGLGILILITQTVRQRASHTHQEAISWRLQTTRVHPATSRT